MRDACFNNQQKIEIICQVLIQIALIYFDHCLGHASELRRTSLLTLSLVEVFPRELTVFMQFFHLTFSLVKVDLVCFISF